jgi:hypothetical protein
MRTPSPLLAAVLLLAAASARTAPPVSVHAEPDGSVAVRFASAGETPAIRFSGLRLSYPGAKAVYRFDGVHAFTNELGDNGLDVTCAAPDTGIPAGVTSPRITARFEPRGARVAVRFRIEGSPTNAPLRVGETMLLRRLGAGMPQRPVLHKTAHWVRDPNGGMPHEEALGSVADFSAFRVAYARGCAPKVEWRDAAAAHAGFRREPDGALVCEFSLHPVAGETSPSPEAIAAEEAGLPFAVRIATTRVYNWFDDPAEPLEATVFARNTGDAPRGIEIAWRVRDWDGTLVSTHDERVAAPPHETLARALTFRSPTARGLFFAEATVRDDATGEELAFARTALALLPPHEFRSTPEDSIFGIAAYWPIPDEESVQRLMDRMGVRWVRQGDTRLQHPPRIANRHTSVRPDDWAKKGRTDAERDAWIRTNLAACVENRNPYWEFCNELNMSTLGIAMEGGGIGKALAAPGYAAWVRRIDEIKREKPEWERIGLLSLGIAGTDGAFLRAVATNGVWGAFAGVCQHPGRGNFTPDYPYRHPENPDARPPASDKVSAHSSFWNFLGSVRLTRETIADLDAEFGGRPDTGTRLWLTEIYAPTPPNGAWEDTLRNSADNALLTWLLAKAEGVRAALWYQLFDSVWHDRLGVKPTDREYFFGLVARDLSFKPALMAYCTAAEALDGATFRGWFDPTALGAPETVHGLLFDTPRGPLAALWDRTDGYVLSDLSAKPYRAPEPWIDPWATKTPVVLPANADTVTVVDSIGRETAVPAQSGAVTVVLDGAVRLVRGLDAARLPLASGK